MLDFYNYHETFYKLTKKYQHRRLDKVLSKYSKLSKSVRETEDYFNELSKYSEQKKSYYEIENQYLK